MAGYSKTPLVGKLGIGEGSRVLLVHAAPGWDRALAPLPPGVTVRGDLRSRGPFDVILVFCARKKTLETAFPKAAARLQEAGGLWIAWPKQASGVATDLTGNQVRAHGLAQGLVDNKVCAVDETWSGLRFVVRLRDRRAQQPRHTRS